MFFNCSWHHRALVACVILVSLPTCLVWYSRRLQVLRRRRVDAARFKAWKDTAWIWWLQNTRSLCAALLGPLALLLDVPGGLQWANVGTIFIYYTQFLRYDRVNELYREEGLEEPLNLWWTLPFSFLLISLSGCGKYTLFLNTGTDNGALLNHPSTQS
jgi:hypothetical protein